MFALIVENSKQERLRLTNNEAQYQLVSVDGTNPPNAQINSYTVSGMDGTRVSSTRLNERNIVLTIKINGDVESNRLFLYNFFNTKEWCKLYLKTSQRDVYIEGYVETATVNMFSENETMQVSIICNDPYFKALDEMVAIISVWVSNFSFPFAIDRGGIPFSYFNVTEDTRVFNESDSTTGAILEVDFFGVANQIVINNKTTLEQMTVNYAFLAGDKLVIDTHKGRKKVLLQRTGQEINLIGKLAVGSKFISISKGWNMFNYTIEIGRAHV